MSNNDNDTSHFGMIYPAPEILDMIMSQYMAFTSETSLLIIFQIKGPAL